MALGRVKYWIRPYLNRLLVVFQTNTYGIKKAYVPNLLPERYIDNPDFADRYQVEVYQAAAKLIKTHRLQSIIDIGCGHGTKLAKYIQPVCNQITGVDAPESIEYCRKHYDFGTWITDDITQPQTNLSTKYDLVMSVDVIEHLINPDHLITYLHKLTTPKTWVLISTPERDLLRGKEHNGPAGKANPAHVREWNQAELATYLTSKGLKIKKHFLVSDVSQPKKPVPGRNFGKTCQVVIGHFT